LVNVTLSRATSNVFQDNFRTRHQLSEFATFEGLCCSGIVITQSMASEVAVLLVWDALCDRQA
jgi:hypothetical protein